MIYMKGEGVNIVVLSSENLAEIAKGRPAVTPDKAVVIGWTPDPEWLGVQLMQCDGDMETICNLIDEASKRPEKKEMRAPFQPKYKHF